MFDEIVKILSLIANKNIYSRESSLCLLNIQYEKNKIINDSDYDIYSLTVKNIGNYNMENIRFNTFECNKTIQPFSINAGEIYSFKLMFPNGWLHYHHGVYERVTYYVVLLNKRKSFAQDLYISCGVNKELVTAFFGKRGW